jgi:hypothetical protein
MIAHAVTRFRGIEARSSARDGVRSSGAGSPRSPGPPIVAVMCRNIRCLHNFEPPTTDDEVREAALQFVRKVSGSTRPSRANAAAFEQAVDEIADATRRMLDQLVTTAPPKSRELEAIKGRQRHEKRMEREVRIRTASARVPEAAPTA